MRSPQLKLFKHTERAHGGTLRNRRKGRGARVIATQNTMHLVLRSTKAKGEWSFRRPQNAKRIGEILQKFASKNCIEIKSFANVGNHLHMHIRVNKRHLYKPFIRAITAAITIAIAGKSWRKNYHRASDTRDIQSNGDSQPGINVRSKLNVSQATSDGSLATTLGLAEQFWDYRPFTRIVAGGLRAFLNLQDYIRINQIEGLGTPRALARAIIYHSRSGFALSNAGI